MRERGGGGGISRTTHNECDADDRRRLDVMNLIDKLQASCVSWGLGCDANDRVKCTKGVVSTPASSGSVILYEKIIKLKTFW